MTYVDEVHHALVLLVPLTAFPTPLSSGGLSRFQRRRLHGFLKSTVGAGTSNSELLAYVSCGHLAEGSKRQSPKNSPAGALLSFVSA